MLLLMGIVLLAFASLGGFWVGREAISVFFPEPTPTLFLPSPTNPMSSAEVLVSGFNAPADEDPLLPTYTPDENPLLPTYTPGEKPLENTPTPTTQMAEFPSVPEPTREIIERAPPATRLVIHTLGIDAPVVEVPITNKTWDVSGLTYEIAHLGGTANPGEKNNMVLAGHVTLRIGAGPFLHVESLEPGDLAIVYAGDQAYTYRVVTKSYIGPTDVSVAYPTSDPILTLITCTDWDAENRRYNQRVAVIAELVEEGTPWAGLDGASRKGGEGKPESGSPTDRDYL
jgi:sortase A